VVCKNSEDIGAFKGGANQNEGGGTAETPGNNGELPVKVVF